MLNDIERSIMEMDDETAERLLTADDSEFWEELQNAQSR